MTTNLSRLTTEDVVADRLVLGAKIRSLRRQQHLSQTELARRLGISPSYLNLIEHNRRAFGDELLVKLAEILPLEIKQFSQADEGRTLTELLEVFGDQLFDSTDVIVQDVKELAGAYPAVAQAFVRLYAAYRGAVNSSQDLTETLSQGAVIDGVFRSRFPNEEVSDLIQRRMNYFPELEEGAERIVHDAKLDSDSIFTGLAKYLKRRVGVEVHVQEAVQMQSAIRRYD